MFLIGYMPSDFLAQFCNEFNEQMAMSNELPFTIKDKKMTCKGVNTGEIFTISLDDIIQIEKEYYQVLKATFPYEHKDWALKIENAINEFEPTKRYGEIKKDFGKNLTYCFYFKDYPIQQPKYEVDPALKL